MSEHEAVPVDATPAPPHRTLRLALAMRGGVSLAVWIGGAVAEIDLFRRACNGQLDANPLRRERGEQYKQLLAETKRYRNVEVDILAGASAGGLNAVLFGLAQSCGTVMDDIVRGTWLQGGGLWELLREPGFGRVPSILKGDERLFTIARTALGEIAREIAPPRGADGGGQYVVTSQPVSNVTVELAATLLDDPGNPYRPNRARFSFTRTPGDLGSGFSTIPAPPTKVEDLAAQRRDRARRKVALDRLALAARATSSFPGAFEPASIYSVSSGAIRPGDTAPLPPDYVGCGSAGVNMARAFQYSRAQGAQPDPFNVVDGGIFDNIPIDRAIRAIQRAPADRPSERFLIYLDPEPPNPQEPVTTTQGRVSAVSWLPTIQRSLTLKQRSESEGDELSLVREHNDAVMETRGRLEALAAVMRTLRTQADGIEATREFVKELITPESYLQYRIAVDGPRIGRLLTDPTAELCYPPNEAVDYVSLNPREAVRIREQLIELFNSTTEAKAHRWKLDTDVCAMLDWTRVLIAWVRALEGLINDYRGAPDEERALVPAAVRTSFFGEDNLIALGKIKHRLYRWLTVLTEAKHRTVDEVLAAPLRSENVQAGKGYPLAQRLQISRGQQFALRLTQPCIDQFDDPESDNSAFYEQLAQPNRFLNEGDPLADAVSERLNAILGEIREFSEPAMTHLWPRQQDPAPAPHWLAYWLDSMYPHFSLAPLNEYPIEQLARIFAVAGVPDTAAIISYGWISSKERPYINVDGLRTAAKAKVLDSWLRSPPDDDAVLWRLRAPHDQRLEPDAKLAGNALMRFGGFLHWRWRENDWQWGRLDAAAGLVKLLVRARRAPLAEQAGVDALADDEPGPVLTPRNGQGAKESQVEEEERAKASTYLQTRILKESAQLEGEGQGQRPPIVTTVGADTMKAVSPHYRFALASRVVPLVCRAMWPARQPVLSVPGLLARLANFVARPLAVPLPLIADPLRLAAALVVVLGSAGFLGAGRTPQFWGVVFAVLLFALGAGIAARAWRTGRNFRALRKRLDSLHDGFPDLRIKQDWVDPLLAPADRRRSRAWCWMFGVAVMVGSVAVGIAAVAGAPLPVESLLAVLAVVFGVQHWLNQRCYRVGTAKSSTSTRRVVLAVVTGVAALVVIVVPPVLAWLQHTGPPPDGQWWWDEASVAVPVGGVAVALLTALSVWGWVHNTWATGSVAGGLVLGALTQWVLLDGTWWNSNLRVLDLLPTAVWLLAMGAILTWLPYRTEGYGEPVKPTVLRSIQASAQGEDEPAASASITNLSGTNGHRRAAGADDSVPQRVCANPNRGAAMVRGVERVHQHRMSAVWARCLRLVGRRSGQVMAGGAVHHVEAAEPAE